MDKILDFMDSSFFKYALFILLLCFGASIQVVESHSLLNLMKNGFFIVVPLVLLFVMIKNHQIEFTNYKKTDIYFVILMVYVLLSMFWSIKPLDTIKNSILFCGTTILALYIGKNYTKEEVMKILLFWCLGLVVVNIVVILLGLGNTQQLDDTRYENAVRGIFKHRNNLGFYMVISASLALWYLIDFWKTNEKLIKIVSAITLVGSLYLLYASKSMTSMLLAVVVILLVILTRFKSFDKLLIYALIPILVLSVYLLVYQPQWFQNIIISLGRSTNLTGRTDIWAGVKNAIAFKPLQGYGFGTFWTTNAYSYLFILPPYRYIPNHAHNGYLDIILDFGIIGAIVIGAWVFTFLKTIKKQIVSNEKREHKYVGYTLVFLTFILVFNLIEGPLVRQCSNIYILLVIFSYAISREGNRETYI